MNEILVAAIAALTGAVAGALGKHRFDQLGKQQDRQRVLRDRYLAHLQDALESLWHRLHNLANRGGRGTMSRDYFEYTTLYAIGRALACERVLILDGMRTSLGIADPKLRDEICRAPVINSLSKPFRHYNRVALAESMLSRGNATWHIETYPQFVERWSSAPTSGHDWREPARNWLSRADDESFRHTMSVLEPLIDRLAAVTKLPNSTTSTRGSRRGEATNRRDARSVEQLESCVPSPQAPTNSELEPSR